MSGHYKNFKTVVYIPAGVARALNEDRISRDYAFLEKYIGLDKVYLETHRGDIDVDRDQILFVKNFLEEKGVEGSGGITTTVNDFDGAEGVKRRMFDTFCYTDPAMRDRIREISEYTAGLFDEVILDDFYFTNCSCERCIKAKGDRDWVTFRRELMADVSKNLIVGPAKAVNPNVKIVIKYPNWRESYHFTGYVPEVEKDIFDATYIGTETRSPAYADQHLPEYLSYSLARYMQNAWPGRCGGGWFDPYQCWSADRYLEQAYLTAFSQVEEMMHFQWSDVVDNYFACAMGFQLSRIDEMMSDAGKAVGVPVYIPFASHGENHLEMRLGMLGLPIEPVADFPAGAGKILLTESALADEDMVDKLVKYVRAGGDAVITTGFLRVAGDKLRASGLTEAYLTGRRINVTRYNVTGDPVGYIEHRDPMLFPEIVHGNNDSWSLLNGGDGDVHASLLLRSSYGAGRLYVLAVPENDADLYRMPKACVDVLKRALTDDVYMSARGASIFTYDDGSLIVYKYVKPDLNASHVLIHTRQKVSALVDTEKGREYPVREISFREDFEHITEYVADVIAEPGVFKKYKWKV